MRRKKLLHYRTQVSSSFFLLQSMPKYMLPEGAGLPGNGGGFNRRFSHYTPFVGAGGPRLGPGGRTRSSCDLLGGGAGGGAGGPGGLDSGSAMSSQDDLNSSEEEGQLARRRIVRCSNRRGASDDVDESAGETSAGPASLQSNPG